MVDYAYEPLASFGEEKNVQLFDRLGVLSDKESLSRMNIQLENYSNAIAIEGQSALAIANTMILPAAQRTQRDVAESLASAKAHGLAVAQQQARLAELAEHIEAFVGCIGELAEACEACDEHELPELEHARAYRDKVIPAMNALRSQADHLEMMTSDDYWPLAKYRELLFIH